MQCSLAASRSPPEMPRVLRAEDTPLSQGWINTHVASSLLTLVTGTSVLPVPHLLERLGLCGPPPHHTCIQRHTHTHTQ